MSLGRRAVALCRPGCDTAEIDRLSRAHDLRVVYTVYTDIGPELAVRIAVQYALDYAAEVVVIPYLAAREARELTAWRPLVWFADLVTATGVVEAGFSEQPRRGDRRDPECPHA
ncbi:hypothetical protein [Nocardia rhamnosiphila]